MKNILIAISFVLLTFSLPCHSEVTFEKDPKGKYSALQLLESIELLDEKVLRSGLTFRVFRVIESGECDPGNEARTCPRSKLFIIAKQSSEGVGGANLWESNRMIGLTLVGKIDVIDTKLSEDQFGAVRIAVSACDAPEGVIASVNGTKQPPLLEKKSYNLVVTSTNLKLEKGLENKDKEYCELY